MAEMKAALAQLKESAAADARYKSALKHNPAGDPAKLETALIAYVHTRELLKAAIATPVVKDNVKAVLQKKLEGAEGRLSELQPAAAQHGVKVPTAAQAALAVKTGSSSVPSSPSSAAASAANPLVPTSLADGAQRPPREAGAGASIAWKRHQKAAVDALKQADQADKKLRQNDDPEVEMGLREQTTALYGAAEAALKKLLESQGVPSSTLDKLAPKLKQVKKRVAEIAKLPDPNAISYTSSEEDDDYDSSSSRAASPTVPVSSPSLFGSTPAGMAAMVTPTAIDAAAQSNGLTAPPPALPAAPLHVQAPAPAPPPVPAPAPPPSLPPVSAPEPAPAPATVDNKPKKKSWKEKQEEAKKKRMAAGGAASAPVTAGDGGSRASTAEMDARDDASSGAPPDGGVKLSAPPRPKKMTWQEKRAEAKRKRQAGDAADNSTETKGSPAATSDGKPRALRLSLFTHLPGLHVIVRSLHNRNRCCA
jgi:hypothetical protein